MQKNGAMTTTEFLFALLRSEIAGNVKPDMNEPLTQDTLLELYRIAKAHDMAHIVSNALQKCGLLGTDEVSQKFLNKQMLSVYRCERSKYALGEICSVFEKEAIPYIPLKGSVLREYYPEEWMRTSCDIDILVRESDLQRAVDALVKLAGYTTDNRSNYHDILLHSPAGIHLELHFNIQEHMDNIDRLLSRVWDYSVCQTSNGFRFDETQEYFVFHHIAHMVYHFIHGGCGIKPFMDLYILKNKMGYDDALVRTYCRQCDIEGFYDNVLYVTDVWFGEQTHTSVSYQIERYVLKGGVYGALENKVTIARSKQGSKANYALSRIFIPYDTLKYLYPVLEKYKFLFPFMQVRRWLKIIFCGKFKRGVRELKFNQNISESSISDMNEFLKAIGL